MYHADPSLPFSLLIFPTNLSATSIIRQKVNPLECFYLYNKGHKLLTAYPILLTQLVNWGESDVNNYMDYNTCCIILPLINKWLLRMPENSIDFKFNLQINIEG